MDTCGPSVLESEFKAAALHFSEQAEYNEQQPDFLKPGNNFQEVQQAIQDCETLYEARKPDSKALKWLRKLCEKVVFYEGVVDVLIQQHPEVVSLIWGAMKFFFLVIWLEIKMRGTEHTNMTSGSDQPRKDSQRPSKSSV